MRSTVLKEIAELSNPNPIDYDPEDIPPDYDPSSSEVEEDKNTGREHYIEVSKSKLRTTHTLLKDPKYQGMTTNRSQIFDVLGRGESEQSQEENEDDGSSVTVEDDEDEQELNAFKLTASEDEYKASSVSEATSESENEEEGDEEQDARRNKVRNLLAQETKAVNSQLTESAQADAEKGLDIKKQLRFYDNLLDARIALQKALLKINSLPRGEMVKKYLDSDSMELARAKEEAYALFTCASELRIHLLPENMTDQLPSLKRKFEETTLSELLNVSETFNQQFQPWRDETLTKWSERVKAASGLPVNKKFKALNQSITNQLRESLTDKERLIERSQVKRAAFTVLGKSDLIDEDKEIIDPEIFDDLDFYHPLLKDLLGRKSLNVTSEMWSQPSQVKKNSKDTKASKGRKLRYHEHEKIQNFMAPMATGTWHESQTDELFGGLLGRRIHVGEGDIEPGEPRLDLSDGLRLFG